jgi:phasin family protein
MTKSAKQLIAAHQWQIESMKSGVSQMFFGFEKLIELNLATSKLALADSFNHTQDILSAKTPSQMLVMQMGRIKQRAAKSVAYGQHLYEIANASASELVASTLRNTVTAVENLSAPAPVPVPVG